MEILRLKEILNEKGVSGKDLAQMVQVTPASISRIVQGQTFPKPELMLKMAEVLNVDIRELFVSTKENPSEKIYVLRNGNYLPVGEFRTDTIQSRPAPKDSFGTLVGTGKTTTK